MKPATPQLLPRQRPFSGSADSWCERKCEQAILQDMYWRHRFRGASNTKRSARLRALLVLRTRVECARLRPCIRLATGAGDPRQGSRPSRRRCLPAETRTPRHGPRAYNRYRHFPVTVNLGSMIGARRSPFSFAALLVWAFAVVRLSLIAASLIFGAQLADFAWDREVHVTPAQAALHSMLIAEGLAHHHGHVTVVAGAAESASFATSQPSVQPGQSSTTFGTPLGQALTSFLPAALFLAGSHVSWSSDRPPASHYPTPTIPPPEAP